MQDFLIIKLQGAMQAWGGHTFEDTAPVIFSLPAVRLSAY